MHAIATRRPAARSPFNRPAPAFALLLARYVAGQIADTRWSAISVALDAAEADSDERAAFAAFCLDAAEDVHLPTPGEIEELLAVTRA